MTWLDRARGAYVRSPPFVRRGLRPLMGLVPAKLKFGRTYSRWRQDIARASADPAFAAARHLASLRALLSKAHAGSPFYRDLIDAAFDGRFDPNTITPADLGRLPILDKAALRAAGEDALAVPSASVDWAETSGSNAEAPFGFYLDKDRSAREMAFVYDVWSRVGFTESDARVCLRGFGLDPNGRNIHDWDPALRELRLSVFPMTIQDAALYLDLIDARGVQFIYGYASAIELFCRQMQVLGRAPRRPIKGIMPISEPVFDHQRRVISEALGNPPFACFYGLSEKALFAAEVPETPGVYEFDPLYGLAELVDDKGEPVTKPGREGRLIGTGFLSTGMPFIRYETGDFARLVQLPTPGNGQRLRVSDLTPRRKPNFLIARDGTRVVTTDLTPASSQSLEGIAEFQFYQDEPGEVLIRYVLDAAGGPGDAERLAAELNQRCHGRLRFQLQPVARIAAGRNGKRAFIDQRLDFVRY
jgi:phenylacetate-CoA ligase